jgi:flagellar hook-associated protein 1 FlgK
MGLAIGLDTAITALRASQLAIDTAAHNIANADTDGYSRQRVDFRAVPPVKVKGNVTGIPLGQLGLGVDSGRIQRLRDGLLDIQYRDVRRGMDQFTQESRALSQAEVTLNEPSDQGIQALLSQFFNGFRDLASQPESVAARSAAVEQGATLSDALNRAASLLKNQRSDLDTAVDTNVADVNAKAKEVANLNGQIRLITVSGGSPNDLLDRRDTLLDDLSGLAGVTIDTGSDNTVSVSIGGRKLVDDINVNELATQPDPANSNLKQVVWAADNAAAGITSGALAGITKARDTSITGLMSDLDGLAGTVISAVNAAHRAGYGLDNSTGLDFFTGADAATIGVNSALRSNPEKLATAGAPDEPGNPDAARAIADVQNALLMGGGTATIDDTYRSIVSKLGVASQQASLQTDNQDVLLRHLDTARQSVSGVSIDEEMTELMKQQHSYQAAARVIQTVDTMLDTLVNRTG